MASGALQTNFANASSTNWAGGPQCRSTVRPGRPEPEPGSFVRTCQSPRCIAVPELLARRDHDAFAQDPAILDAAFDIALTENARLASDAIVTLVGVAAPQRILLVLVRGVLEATALGCGQSIFCFQTTGREVLI